jgi:uncharacterized protein (DUF433 family)
MRGWVRCVEFLFQTALRLCSFVGVESFTLLSANPMDYHDIITLEADKRGGKPCIRGLRMTVADVLEYLASGMTTDEILADFPDLTREDIQACLAFAADREHHSSVHQTKHYETAA